MRFGTYLKGLNDRCKNYATGCSGRFFAPPRLTKGMESPKNRRKMADDSCQVEVEPGGSCRREPKRTPTGLPLWEFFRGLSRETADSGFPDERWRMVHFYCPFCWKEFDEDLPQCPHCGAEIHAFWKSKSYLEKLIVALNHPEPSTVMRAVWLLQQLGDRRAVEPLKRLLDRTQDIYLRRAALRTLDELEESIR